MLVKVLLALTVIMITARVVGLLFARLNQPAVIGEVVGGILLGPSLLGRLSPEAAAFLLPADAAPFLGVIAQLGVILYMFLVGLELDLRRAARRASRSRIAISHASIVVPFVLGVALAFGCIDVAGARRRAVHVVRAVHRRVDVDHGVPGAGAHPRRPRAAADAAGHARADLRRHRRRHGVVPAGVRGRRDAGHAGWRAIRTVGAHRSCTSR